MILLLAVSFGIYLQANSPEPPEQETVISINPLSYSVHVGDRVSYNLHVPRLHGPIPNRPDLSYRNYVDQPVSTGLHTIGPVSFTNGDDVLTAPAITITVHPQDTNAFFHIHVQSFEGVTNQCVEVLLETQSAIHVVMPYATTSLKDTNLHFLAAGVSSEEWQVEGTCGRWGPRYEQASGSMATIHNRRFERYRFTPLRTGLLTITSSHFTNLPPDHPFEPFKINIGPNWSPGHSKP